MNLGAVGVIDYDEACYAEVSRVMFLEGELLEPSLNGEPFFEKPPFVYWTQVAGFRLFGVNSFGARFFNALAGVATLLVLYLAARPHLGSRVALFAAVILGSSIEFVVLSRVTLTDVWLALWFTACLGTFFAADERDRDGGNGLPLFLVSCVCSGLAMLTKGAIGFVLPVGAAVIYLVSQRRLGLLFRPTWMIPGVVVLFGIGLSWYLALGFTRPEGFEFMRELFVEHHVGRFTEPMQGHGGPMVYYLPVLLGGLLPWSPFLWHAITCGELRGSADPRHRFLRLFGIFAVLTFVFFSVAATKLPNYIAPVFPAVALLLANFVDRLGDRSPTGRGWSIAVGSSVGILGLLAVIFLAAPWIVSQLPNWLGDKALKKPGLMEPIALGATPYLAAAVLGLGGYAVFRVRTSSVRTLFRTLCPVMIAFVVLIAYALLPAYDRHLARPLRDAAALADRTLADRTLKGDEPIVLVGIRHAPSVSFYTGRTTVRVGRGDHETHEQIVQGGARRVGIVVEQYLERLQAHGRVDVIGRFNGYAVFVVGF